jgi:putative DNA primase/helicase
VKAELQRQGLIEGVSPRPLEGRERTPRPPRQPDPDVDQAARIEIAMQIWAASVPLPGTLGWRYFTEQRGLHIGSLSDLSHGLRWHHGINAVVALMTDPLTNRPRGVHRTFLAADAVKLERRMLGKQGVVRLSPNDQVTQGLGIAEGLEDGLAVLLSGWAPIWAATSAGAIERLPVLSGIENLTVFADTDATGMKAAGVCAARWIVAGREARISPAKELTDAA